MKTIGIFFGSTTGNSEAAAYKLAGEFGEDVTRVFNVIGAGIPEVSNFKNIIMGCSTWEMGDLQVNFESFLSRLRKVNLEGKKVAIFGCGDQVNYPDTFADSIGIIHEALQPAGCEIIGTIPLRGYTFSRSKARKNNNFLGLPLDEINQGDLTSGRIKKWTDILKKEFFQ